MITITLWPICLRYCHIFLARLSKFPPLTPINSCYLDIVGADREGRHDALRSSECAGVRVCSRKENLSAHLASRPTDESHACRTNGQDNRCVSTFISAREYWNTCSVIVEMEGKLVLVFPWVEQDPFDFCGAADQVFVRYICPNYKLEPSALFHEFPPL